MNKIVIKWSIVATLSSIATAIGGIVGGIAAQKAVAAAQPQPTTPETQIAPVVNAELNK